VTGPPASAPDAAKQGFAKKSGVPVSALQEKNGRLVATVVTRGVATADVLPAFLEGLIRSIPSRKSMRWDSLETDPFPRPVHWILATLDGQPFPVSFADVKSSTVTFGHRFHPGSMQVTARDYLESCAKTTSWPTGMSASSASPKKSRARLARRADGRAPTTICSRP